MADIIVMVPKDQVEHFLEDKMQAIEAWWFLPRRPLRLKYAGLYEGDLIGFVFEGAIRYAATVIGIEQNEQGRWEIHFQDCGWIAPIPHEHFRGFRYYDLHPAQKGEE